MTKNEKEEWKGSKDLEEGMVRKMKKKRKEEGKSNKEVRKDRRRG